MKNKLLLQIVFWALMIGINISLTPSILPFKETVLNLLITLLFQGMVFYLNVLWLFPKFFNYNRNTFFVLLSIASVIFFAVLFTVVENYLVDLRPLRSERPERMKPAGTGYHGPRIFEQIGIKDFGPRSIINFLRGLFWIILPNILSTVYLMQNRLIKQDIRNREITAEKLSTELQLLKAQINPHFLFNALNNIYSLSYLKSDKAPISILKLSNMLRYVIEECKKDRVPIHSEVGYIENYISLNKMKSPSEMNISFERPDEELNLKIAPMLFIPFVENSFKYSRIEEIENAFINIKMYMTKDQICFTIGNSFPEEGKANKGAGMGIDNVKQRLEIIYPEKHTLQIKERDNEFLVALIVELE